MIALRVAHREDDRVVAKETIVLERPNKEVTK